MYSVILAGGKGKRFWPFSRARKPKQFLDITGAGSMLALTFQRLREIVPPERILLLTVAEQVELVHNELPDLPAQNIFAEPEGRNTAPSLAVAAALVAHRGGDEPLLCCPADHIIEYADAFRALVTAAGDIAAGDDVLITFGITPDRPATGYGYIEAGREMGECGGQRFYYVKKFHEKPDGVRAESYLERGGYYWNSGIFLWRPSVFLESWRRFLPEGAGPLERIARAFDQPDQESVVRAQYPKMPAISVDYGILERADNVIVGPANLGWNDVGSWDALFDILPSNGKGNVGAGTMELIDSSGNLFFNPDGVTAAVGVDNLIVVVEGQTVLVCKRGQSERVRDLLESIETKGDAELL
ncbi:MAG: mannose-1-phosphate guanylyltransferase [bacterium]|nr:MAG: mannose-1-phosphate guanylyltransferase [bacterium]